MAEFFEVIKRKKRMCDYNNCSDCSLSSQNNGKGDGCNNFVINHPQEAEKIIMDWAKEHPAMTNADKFREVFGFELDYEGNSCLGCKCWEHDCSKCEYRNFWNKEYVEPKENKDGKKEVEE